MVVVANDIRKEAQEEMEKTAMENTSLKEKLNQLQVELEKTAASSAKGDHDEILCSSARMVTHVFILMLIMKVDERSALAGIVDIFVIEKLSLSRQVEAFPAAA